MHERYYFADVHCRGHYPAYAKKEWEREGTAPVMEPGDEAILAEGAVDYLGFSYYMSNAVRSDVAVESDGISGGNAHTVPNPYVKASDWGWQIDPVGLRLRTGHPVRAVREAAVYRGERLRRHRQTPARPHL